MRQGGFDPRQGPRVLAPTLLIGGALLGGTAQAADDTFACLENFSGPAARISGDQGLAQLSRQRWQPEARFDARGAVWRSHLVPDESKVENCYPVQIGADWQGCPPNRFDLYDDASNVPPAGPPMCFAGATIIGTQSEELSWKNVKASAGTSITVNAEHAIVDGVRVHNQEDPIVPLTSRYFEFRNSWVTYNRDDCVENDAFASGRIDDNLFDGCYVFYSARNTKPEDPPVAPGGGAEAVVEISNSLIRLEPLPGPHCDGVCLKPGYKAFFKLERWNRSARSRSPRLELHDNVFFASQEANFSMRHMNKMGIPETYVEDCSNNIIVWTGEGDFPGEYPEDCFTVTKDRSVWEHAKQNWIDCHPKVPRLPSDPKSDASRCEPSAPGGGGSVRKAATR